MSTDTLVSAVKDIVGHAKAGRLDEAYAGYQKLFSSPSFPSHRPEDQRQALRLMVMARGVPDPPTPAMVEAHRAAIAPLTELVSALGEPADHELLGICHLCVGNTESASSIFKAGLAIERERNPSSDLCGVLMKRVSLI
jgi:hypothetical protein